MKLYWGLEVADAREWEEHMMMLEAEEAEGFDARAEEVLWPEEPQFDYSVE